MNRLTDVMTQLAACLCAQIREDGSPEPCFCGIVAGDTAIGDYAGECEEEGTCGMAWVRLTTAYPATGVGVVSEEVGNCSSTLGYELEVGILRCFPVNDDGNPPTAAEMLAAAEQQHADLLTMHRAIFCCSAVSSKDSIVSTYTPSGPLGGLYGGTMTVMLAL